MLTSVGHFIPGLIAAQLVVPNQLLVAKFVERFRVIAEAAVSSHDQKPRDLRVRT